MIEIRRLLSDLRWRTKPVRWAGKIARLVGRSVRGRPRTAYPTPAQKRSDLADKLQRHGFLTLPFELTPAEIDLSPLLGAAGGKSFVDLSDRFPDAFNEMFSQVVNNPIISELVLDYFDGEPWLWNAALNYSDPSRELTDSQLWHFDYGDVRQLHILVYFSDVDETSGPFTFLTGYLSDQIKRHPFLIERLTDADLSRRYALDPKQQATRLCGNRGQVFLNDPGRLLHQGARCETPRLVMFVSFTTPTPMSNGGRSTMSRSKRRALAEISRSGRMSSSLPETIFG